MAAIRRLVSRADAHRVRLEKRVDAALNRGASIPSLEPDTRAWTPFMYFEYDEHSSV